MNDLARIERQYGSVAEYNRCNEEESSRRWEQGQRAAERYEENRRQIEIHQEAGHCQMAEAFCDIEQCETCKNRTETFSRDEEDDIGTFFCLDNNCNYYKNKGDE